MQPLSETPQRMDIVADTQREHTAATPGARETEGLRFSGPQGGIPRWER